MEPTNRRETGTRTSAMKRYGPFVAIIVVIAVVVGVLVLTGGDDSSKKKANTNGQVNTSAGPVIINDSNRDSINWGPNCDTKVGRVKIPLTYAPPCVKPFTGDNGGATADGVTADSIKVVVYIGDPAKNVLQSASIKGAGADVSPATAKETCSRSTPSSTAARSTCSSSMGPAVRWTRSRLAPMPRPSRTCTPSRC